MDYEQFSNDVLGFFEDNLPTVLSAISTVKTDITLPHPNLYLETLPDMSRSEPVILYMLSNDFLYESLSNESDALNTELEFYITFKNLKFSNDDLDKIMKRYGTAIYTLIKENYTFDGLVDGSLLTAMHFFEAAEGFSNAKALRFTVQIQKKI